MILYVIFAPFLTQRRIVMNTDFVQNIFNTITYEDGTSSCGTGININADANHAVVVRALKDASDFFYRSGFNPVTGENDGSGILFGELSRKFFEKKILLGEFGTEIQTQLQNHHALNKHKLDKLNQEIKALQKFIYTQHRPDNVYLHKKLKSKIAHQLRLKHFLSENQFAIGQYFLSQNIEEADRAKQLIASEVNKQGLMIVWRDMSQHNATNPTVLSAIALKKMPSIWQALIVPDLNRKKHLSHDFEFIVQNLTACVLKESLKQNCDIDIISQSSKSIIYKGMICSNILGQFYLDLVDVDFTAKAAIVHARYATNTDPQWRNAQPCWLLGHNGEFNSKDTNLKEMDDVLRHFSMEHQNVDVIFSDSKLSDSMQLNRDIFNLMTYKQLSLEEACVRLLPPALDATKYSPEINALLELFALERTPYNGPGLITLFARDSYLVKLDNSGLRPARVCIIKNKITHKINAFVASDDNIVPAADEEVIYKGQMQAGDLIMFSPSKGFLTTEKVLQRVETQVRQRENLQHVPDAFRALLSASLVPLNFTEDESVLPAEEFSLIGKRLNKRLVQAGYSQESVFDILSMAEKGAERLGAMGDDTDPLQLKRNPARVSDFFHGEFCEVTAPPLDSVKETYQFSLKTALGPVRREVTVNTIQIMLPSPILELNDLQKLIAHPDISTQFLDLGFEVMHDETISEEQALVLLRSAISSLVRLAEEKVRSGVQILILSDKDSHSEHTAFIPDLIALAAVRKHLEFKGLMRHVSLVVDSYQIDGPHQVTTLLTMGASAVYTRGAYAKIVQHCLEHTNIVLDEYLHNFQYALKKCLLKTMGKVGINNVNNFINGQFVSAIGLDFTAEDPSIVSLSLEEYPSLSKIFANLYSPMGGKTLNDIAYGVINRHLHANTQEWTILPNSGQYMPDPGGMDHGYDTYVVNAFSQWMLQENERQTLHELDAVRKKWLMVREQNTANIDEMLNQINHPYLPESGFLDPSMKAANGSFYPPEYLATLQTSQYFKEMCVKLDEFKNKYPTSIKDYLHLKEHEVLEPIADLQTTESIRKCLFTGHMSQGALTLRAHETFSQALNAVGANSAAGEGGESPSVLRSPLLSTKGKQIASGRFGVSAEQILFAKEIEIKVAQGAKPGEGGELPGSKVTIRFAAQRGGLPGIGVSSPPPHHDIYSIEDLEQLIHDIKSINERVNVSVKLVASKGIGTIAVGVAKAGADVINIAGNSGGTAAAQQSSIRHAGLPAEIGVVEVTRALRKAGLRQLVKIRSSGGYKTPDDIIKVAILGVNLFELGSTTMITGGCKMQKTCNESCKPGVAADGELFQGKPEDTERYYVSMASGIQDKLRSLGVANLDALEGRFDLLEVSPALKIKYTGFEELFLSRPNIKAPSFEIIAAAMRLRLDNWRSAKEAFIIQKIEQFFIDNPNGTFDSSVELSENLVLNTQDRTWGANIIGHFLNYLDAHPNAKICLKTEGLAGQSMAFVCHKNIEIEHRGTVQDGCGKSMTGGKLIVKTPSLQDGYSAKYRPELNTIAGNALLYGASGGEAYINGVAGQRCGVLLKGATVVVEGVGDLAFEFMTSGTSMILGRVGKGLCNSAMGGIIFVYGQEHKFADSVRAAVSDEASAYKDAIKQMLTNHWHATRSEQARRIIKNFEQLYTNFQILIPREMDKKNSLQDFIDLIETYKLRQAPLTLGMEVWFIEKIRTWFAQQTTIYSQADYNNLQKLAEFLALQKSHEIFSDLMLASQAYIQVQNSLQIITARLLNTTNIVVEQKSVDNVDDAKIGWLSVAQWRLLREAFTAQIQQTPFIAFTGSACPAPCEDSCTENIPQLQAELAKSVKNTPHKKLLDVHERLSSISGLNDVAFRQTIDSLKYYIAELTHDAENCTSCRAQSCAGGGREEVSSGCPIGKPINTINTLLKAMKLHSHDAHLHDLEDLHLATKPIGQGVHIKDIELILYHIGEELGWFDEMGVELSPAICDLLFGGKNIEETLQNKAKYDVIMQEFTPPFKNAPVMHPLRRQKEIIVVGSGPAGMEVAYLALLHGFKVKMYEKSERAGGLLIDGIPAHKFNKDYVTRAFTRLNRMGLELYLNAEITVGLNPTTQSHEYIYNQDVIFRASDQNKYLVLAIGSGKPLELGARVVENLPERGKGKIIQAIDFLKSANDLALQLHLQPDLSLSQREELIQATMGVFDPRGKKVLVIGGGDTAQDALRWISRFFAESRRLLVEQALSELRKLEVDFKFVSDIKLSIRDLRATWKALQLSEQSATQINQLFDELEAKEGQLITLVRSFEQESTPIKSAYPFRHFSKMSTENGIRNEEIEFIAGNAHYLVAPTMITLNDNDKLNITFNESECLYTDLVTSQDLDLSQDDRERLLTKTRALSRTNRPLKNIGDKSIDDVDLIYCALGFEKGANSELVKAALRDVNDNIVVVGDAADAKEKIIIGATANASNTFFNRVLKAENAFEKAVSILNNSRLGFMSASSNQDNIVETLMNPLIFK